ncbi:MAG: twin-arginine translocase subunit TatC [bacterium]|nr:twin-arginine translocase subunit TatC [bacterium]
MAIKPISEQLKFWDHIEELRIRIIRSFLGVLVGSILGLIFTKHFLKILTIPFQKAFPDRTLVLLSPTEGFSVYFLVGISGGILLALPWVFYQLWGFVSPALKLNEKKTILPLVFLSTFLFLLGAIFAWWILPNALLVLSQFAKEISNVFWSLDTYITFTVLLAIAFGGMFQLPLITAVLIRLDLVTKKTFRKYRRIAYILILILSAIITPTTDVFTLVLLSIPLILMYELSILIGSLWHRRSEKT